MGFCGESRMKSSNIRAYCMQLRGALKVRGGRPIVRQTRKGAMTGCVKKTPFLGKSYRPAGGEVNSTSLGRASWSGRQAGGSES